jgi:hypothetical protein
MNEVLVIGGTAAIPQVRNNRHPAGTAASCQEWTLTERFRRLEIDHQLELCQLLMSRSAGFENSRLAPGARAIEPCASVA